LFNPNGALRQRRKLIVSALLGVLAALALSSPAQAQTPTLLGEFLSGNTIFGTFSATVNCNPAGTSSVTASASGVAIGPYPGTFEENVTLTLGPQDAAGISLVESAQADFRIDSGDTVITGTKQLAVGGQSAAICETREEPPGQCSARTTTFSAGAIVDYQATITTPTETVNETGTASLAVTATRQVDCATGEELFFSGTLTESFVFSSRASTIGKATGGGQIMRTTSATPVTFGFVAQSNDSKLKGHCEVVDHLTDTHVTCLDVTSFVQTGNRVTFSGNASVDGMPTTYRIDVQDNGEPGAGTDTFAIQTASGFTAGGVVVVGNVQVR
jgi:hypothetical protein